MRASDRILRASSTEANVASHDSTIGRSARQFARLTPQTHGEKQKHFDAIYAVLAELHRRVLREGKPVAGK